MKDESAPIEVSIYSSGTRRIEELQSVSTGLTSIFSTNKGQALKTLSSYSFDKSILTPASAFRFTAEGVDYEVIQKIRSGDTVELWVKNQKGVKLQLATGFIDETDSHTNAHVDEFSITGRDTLGQLVDNSAIDKNNRIIYIKNSSLVKIAEALVENTRMPMTIIDSGCPKGNILFRTVPGETKMSALQRYLEYTNCLVWADPAGVMTIGKPNMSQASLGGLLCLKTKPQMNNVLDIRVRRNLTSAIRLMAVQLQTLNAVDPLSSTKKNKDDEVMEGEDYMIGRSVYRAFTLGNGDDAVNSIFHIGNNPSANVIQNIGDALAYREIARSNMSILDVECVVRGHVNDDGLPFDIDQVYTVLYEKEKIEDDMYVYSVRYDLTREHGMLTTLRLCKLFTIVADVPTIPKPRFSI